MTEDLLSAAFTEFMDREYPGWREAGAEWRADMRLAFLAGRVSMAKTNGN